MMARGEGGAGRGEWGGHLDVLIQAGGEEDDGQG
jgi:hypothetical protein